MQTPSSSTDKVTIVDVSRLAGCSKAVVSAVVNKARGNIAVSPATRARVMEAARQLGYRPNFASRSLARRSTNTIGIYVPPRAEASLGYSYEGRILFGIERACRKYGFDLLVINVGGAVTPEQCFTKFAEGRVDGLLLMHVQEDSDWLVPLLRSNANVVSVNYYGPVDGLTNVVFDDAAASGLGVQHLVELGHRRIAYVGAVDVNLGPGGTLRCQGYRRAMASAGLEVRPEWVWDCSNPRFDRPVEMGWNSVEGAHGVDFLMRLPVEQRPTGIVFYDDGIAAMAHQRLAELGIAMPGEVSLVGIDDSDLAKHLYPSLTSIRQPLDEMGFRAADMLMAGATRRAQEGETAVPEPARELWPPTLIPRLSTGPAKP